MEMMAVREDVWREAAADRERDEGLAAGVAALQASVLAAVRRAEEAEAIRDQLAEPWEWVERASLLLGLAVSGWLARGGLRRLVRRFWCSRGPAAPPPALVDLEAAGQ
jgi:hypothetical protein